MNRDLLEKARPIKKGLVYVIIAAALLGIVALGIWGPQWS